MSRIHGNRSGVGSRLSCLFTGVVTFGAVTIAMADDAIYSNDFTTRTSLGAIPRIGETYTATPYPSTSSRLYPYHDTPANNYLSEPCLNLLGYHGWLDFSPAYYAQSNGTGTSRPSLDGWFQPYFSKGSASSIDNLFHHTGTLYVDNGNPCFRFAYQPASSAQRTGIALKSIHNAFTNGQLRIQVDFKMPSWSTQSQGAQFWMFPVYDKYMDIETWGGEIKMPECSPALFGLRSGGDLTRPYLQRYTASGNEQFGNNYGSTDNAYRIPWMRYIMTYDLDQGKVSGTEYALSDWTHLDVYTNVESYCSIGHPTLDTATKTIKTQTVASNKYFIGCDSSTDLASFLQERGGISGIGFFVGNVGKAANQGVNLNGSLFAAANNKPMADNIRVSWKAPGASDFETVYEDDFETRTYKRVNMPTVGTTGAYPAGTESTGPVIDVFTGYVKGKDTSHEDGYNLFATIPGVVNPAATTLQPIGIDGWRRICPLADRAGGHVWTCTDSDKGSGGNKLCFGAAGSYTCLANLIGEEVTSGKVKMSVDAFVPRKDPDDNGFYANALQRCAVALGPKALHASLTAQIPGNTVAGGGIGLERTGSAGSYVTNYFPFVYGTDASLVRHDEASTPMLNWYRFEVEADLDAGKYSMTITSHETGELSVADGTEPTAEPALVVVDAPLAADASAGIGAFYLWGWGYGGTLKYSQNRKVAFDNIKIWKISSDGATTNMLYANTFDKRTRVLPDSTRASGRLAYQYDRDDGPDHWIRRHGSGAATFDAEATVRDDGGNQFLSMGRTAGDGHTVRYMTSIGTAIDHGRLTVTADICPPEYWFGQNGGSVFVTLGNKILEQSEAKDSDSGQLLRFGFRESTKANNGGRFDDMRPCVVSSSDGTAVGTGSGAYNYLSEAIDGKARKWYRFVARVNVDAATYSASVYDMGTTHPTPESPHGALVGSATDLHLMNPLEDGISSLDVACYAVSSTLGETGIDPLHALIDNISITCPKGLVLIMR